MKRLFFISLACCVLAFAGCSKDDEPQQTITNLSGVGWYDAQIWFRNSEGGELSGYKTVGTVSIGESCKVSASTTYFYVYAKSASGKLLMSNDIPFSSAGKTNVTANDMY